MIFLSYTKLRESRNLDHIISPMLFGERARASGIYSVTEWHSLFTNWLKNGSIGWRGRRKEIGEESKGKNS